MKINSDSELEILASEIADKIEQINFLLQAKSKSVNSILECINGKLDNYGLDLKKNFADTKTSLTQKDSNIKANLKKDETKIIKLLPPDQLA